MLKEYTVKHYKKVCDSCGLEHDPDSKVFSASMHASFYTMLDKDLCDLCYHAVVDEFIKERIITKDNLNEVLEVMIPPTRLGSFDTSTTFNVGGLTDRVYGD